MVGHLAYLTLLAGMIAGLSGLSISGAREAIIVLGVIGLWRYSWAGLNFARAIYFRRWIYPKRKQICQQAYDLRGRPAKAYFLVTSYKIDPEVTLAVYKSVLKAACASEGGTHIIASVVERSDARLIETLFERLSIGFPNVSWQIDRIPGTGKRDALAAGLKKIAAHCPTREDIVILVDGDSCIPENIVAQSAPFFTNTKIGALTTDEVAQTPRPGYFRDWFQLRFDQRQVMMCSMGLSNRVLTLTGRMSVFRADLATTADFIRKIELDHLDHWRLGRVRFLTGDDKSTWFWLLKQGYEMVYLPDVRSVSLEYPPRARFVPSATTLMVRWFGNMLRTNGRALALGQRDIGGFVWWSLLDQRMSIWTTLVGPLAALIAALLFDPIIFLVYVTWIMATRYVFCAAISAFRGHGFPVTFPFLLYFSQLFGACVKSYVFFRLDRQKWTRQQTEGATEPRQYFWRNAISLYLHTLALGWLTIGVFYLVGSGS